MKSLCLNHFREKSTGFHIIQMKIVFMNFMDLGYGQSFHLPKSQPSLQKTILEEIV